MTYCRVVSCGGTGHRQKAPLPLWVNRVTLSVRRSLLVFPD
jgi:hypothetical protein